MKQNPIVEAEFDIIDGRKMAFALFKPRLESDRRTWGCKFEFSEPLDVERTTFGENSLQALVLALKIASTYLYSSDLYKKGQIGVFGELGGSLIFPAPQSLLNIAPFPF
jgi:hypothetical protein